jgi:hypothetical protein
MGESPRTVDLGLGRRVVRACTLSCHGTAPPHGATHWRRTDRNHSWLPTSSNNHSPKRTERENQRQERHPLHRGGFMGEQGTRGGGLGSGPLRRPVWICTSQQARVTAMQWAQWGCRPTASSSAMRPESGSGGALAWEVVGEAQRGLAAARACHCPFPSSRAPAHHPPHSRLAAGRERPARRRQAPPRQRLTACEPIVILGGGRSGK